MVDRIEKQIELKAPVSRVWRAITDYREFGEWFKVRLDGPFVPGQVSTGQITYPGYEHLKWEAMVQEMQPERLFSYTWNPGLNGFAPVDTLVEFRLEPTATGTLLTVTESGFEKLGEMAAEALRRNEGGWTTQMKNIESYVAGKP